MARLNVLVYPDERLKIIAKPVVEVNDEIQKLWIICLKQCTLKKGLD